MLKNKRIVLGVTGSIAVFKAAALASKLTQMGAEVDVILTSNACKLISPALFEGLTHRKCHTDTFEDCHDLASSHVTLGSHADLIVIAPCTANMMAKIAHGIADDKLSTTMLAARCPIIVSPAMNCFMYENAATQENIATLKRRGITVLEPGVGPLACGYSAKGRMPEPEDIAEIVSMMTADDKILKGQKVLVTAGPTREHIDAVRFISNPSTGKMGYACAKAALMAGADVTLVTGPTALKPVVGAKMIYVQSAAQMFEAVKTCANDADIIIMTAAVADFTPEHVETCKLHKTEAPLEIKLKHTEDILQYLGKHRRPGQKLCGFCMETADLINRAYYKLEKKGVDLIVANDLNAKGCGFAGDTNGVTLVTADSIKTLDVADKLDIAQEIIRTLARFE